jgi:hypothetical protein
MKTTKHQSIMAVMAVTGLLWSATSVLAQNSPTGNLAPSAAVGASVPQLSYGVPQVLQLKQAEIGDATIIAYIKNSGNSYALDADQIIYLRQQGLSDAVITAMLQQPKPMNTAVAAPAEPAPQPVASTSQPVSTATVAPSVTYVQAVPAPAYYYQPYYYPAYGVYPAVSFSFGWGGGWHGGGYYGGWHGGGWHH